MVNWYELVNIVSAALCIFSAGYFALCSYELHRYWDHERRGAATTRSLDEAARIIEAQQNEIRLLQEANQRLATRLRFHVINGRGQ